MKSNAKRVLICDKCVREAIRERARNQTEERKAKYVEYMKTAECAFY